MDKITLNSVWYNCIRFTHFIEQEQGKKIAQEIGVHPSTLSRELNRNPVKGVKQLESMQRITGQRHLNKPKGVKFPLR
jgi:IS30 family transposase